MNTVGWSGGALGPLAVGWLAAHGRHTKEIDNMSEAITWCGAVYLCSTAALVAAWLIVFRQRRSFS